MSIHILLPGLLTTIQDKGRFGFQQQGVIVGGAMDGFALRAANLAVGNDEGAAALEVTLLGPKLRFDRESVIAICGADLSPAMNGVPVPQWRPVFIQAGGILEFGACKSGVRAYIAAAGGFDVPLVMRSRSTYLRAGLGGCEGRALKAGDVLHPDRPTDSSLLLMKRLSKEGSSQPYRAADWCIGHDVRPAYAKNPVVRFVRGSDYGHFTEESRHLLVSGQFQVSPQSDRMGYRLEGIKLGLQEALEPISEAVTAGTIQVPPGGNPIILMADRQTIGGYPKIAQIAEVDLPLLAQVQPGSAIRFCEISRQESEELYIGQELQIRKLSGAIEIRLREM